MTRISYASNSSVPSIILGTKQETLVLGFVLLPYLFFFYISFLTLDVVSHHVPLDMHICILPMFSVSRFIFGQQSPVSTFIKTDCLGLVLANTPCT